MDTEAESNPDRWVRFTYTPRLRSACAQLAAFIGAKTEECVLVPNASHGVSTVLSNIEWQKDDIIVIYNITYNSVLSSVQYISEKAPYPTLSEIHLTFPTTPARILAQYRDHLRGLPPRKAGQRVFAIIDAIFAMPAIVMPWKEMVQICKEENVMTLIDAAHSIGQEVNLNLNEADPDFWISNCHKWLYTKRPCAVLYVPLRNQHLIRSTFPTSASYLPPADWKPSNFVTQFEWIATMDFVPFLSVEIAFEFRQWLGGEEKINAYCRRIAGQGQERLAQILGTSDVKLDPSGKMTLNMVDVKLPLPSEIGPKAAIIAQMKKKLLMDRNIYGQVYFLDTIGYMVRCSAQIWNEVNVFVFGVDLRVLTCISGWRFREAWKGVVGALHLPLVYGNQHPLNGPEPPQQTWLEKYGSQIDQPFSGPLAFSHIPYTRCLEDESQLFDIAILGLPFDTGVSYRPGARFGPYAIRSGSRRQREARGYTMSWGNNPYNLGAKIVDCGDVPVNPFDNALAVDQMEVAYSTLLSRATASGMEHPRIVRPGYAGGVTDQSKVTHGTFFYLAQEEGLMTNTSIHAGIRCKLGVMALELNAALMLIAFVCQGPEDLENDEAVGFQLISTDDIDDLGISEIIRRIRERVGSSPVYLSLDIDVIVVKILTDSKDPGIAPATGTPEAGGWTTRELKRIIRGLAGLNFVGADLVEVAPAYDVAEVTAVAAADLVHDFLSLFLSDKPPINSHTRHAPAQDEL
ncbi:Arginase/deacetylase [Favolaschia claudopus]|uniref:Arginase/deacetylase n=1 Tax=Favolaschia claudopus TaxID=2862362 RepID=A0AAW0EGP8_9AGAR